MRIGVDTASIGMWANDWALNNDGEMQMNKIERDKLRALCDAVAMARAQKSPYEAVDEFKREMDANHMLALLDHIDALERQIREAFEEGWCEALDKDGARTLYVAWTKSKAAIASASEES